MTRTRNVLKLFSALIFVLGGFFVGTSAMAQVEYGVQIDETTGIVSGYAWSDQLGWIDFNAVTYDSATRELQGNAVITNAEDNGKDGALHMQGDCTPTCGGYGVTITATGRFVGHAWNETIGWVDFEPTYGGVTHSNTKTPSVNGWAWNDYFGWIQMSSSQLTDPGAFGVHLDESTGAISRYAWSEEVGWIDFNGLAYNSSTGAIEGSADITSLSQQGLDGALHMQGDCTPTCGGYGVFMNELGLWEGYAWNEVFGWVIFNPSGYGGVWHQFGAAVPSVTGWAWSDMFGWIEMGPPPTFGDGPCSASAYNTCRWAWNDQIGWVAHNSVDVSTVPHFGVHIDPDTDDVSGHAWNDILGYIDFSNTAYDSSTGEFSSDAIILGLGVSDGALSLRGDCTPTCGGYGVTIVNDQLTGFAWNDIIGWVDFQPSLGGVNYVDPQNPNIQGWAWNDAYGWIAFRFTDYNFDWGVNVDDDSNISGYAWSDEIGWIDYDPAGPYPEAPGHSALWNPLNGEISGWAKMLGFDELGIDPWIKLRDTGAIPYGVSLDPNTGLWSGYGWNELLGWFEYTHPYNVVETRLSVVNTVFVPYLISPLNCVDTYTISPGAALSPTLEWAAYTSTDGTVQTAYHVQVDTDPLFSAPFVDEVVNTDGNTYSIGLGLLNYNQAYYWRVRVQNDTGTWSEWSEAGAGGESNCFRSPDHAPPECAFTMAPAQPAKDQPVQFSDETITYGGSSKALWYWDFGDGDTQSGSDPGTNENPIHIYEELGPVTVSLTVTDSSGYECSTSTEAEVAELLPEFRRVVPR